MSFTPSTSKSSLVSDLARKIGSDKTNPGAVKFHNDGRIKQSERLFTARPRYAPQAKDQDDVYTKSTGTRGTHAYIKLLTSTAQADSYVKTKGIREDAALTGPGSIVSTMVHSSSSVGYDEFLITRVSCQMQEKLQVTEVFGDGEVAYYFGRQPLMFNISGVLIDSPDNTWFTNFLRTYASVMRGTQLAQNHELLRLVLPSMTLTGSISGMSWDQDSGNDVAIQFSFQFLAKRVDPTAPVLTNVTDADMQSLIDFGKASKMISQQKINDIKQQSAALEDVVKNPNSTVADLGSALSKVGQGAGGTDKDKKKEEPNFLQQMNSDLQKWVKGQKKEGDATSKSLFSSVTANLTGIRTQLFSPVYGILTSLIKLVKNTAGQVNNVFNSLFKPVQNILRDITNISKQAVRLVNQVNSSIRGIGRNLTRQIAGTQGEFNKAMKSVGKAAGAIATSPKTVLQSVQEMFSAGAIPAEAAFLRENRRASLSGAAVLRSNSGGNGGGASLASGAKVSYKVAILRSLAPYSTEGAATL